MKNIKNRVLTITTYLFALALPILTFAQADTGPTKLPNPIKSNTIGALLAQILDIMLTIGLPIIVVFFIFSGFRFVAAQGNETKLTEAKRGFKWTFIGAAILLGAKVLAELLQGTAALF